VTTLVLGLAGAAIGGAIGGPLGASIGWSLGALAGSALDPPKIEGPRINDRKLQTSTYGTPIPIVYGSFRLAGAVIWQTDLQEHSQKSGGKGGPETTTYTYTASYAILICEGPVVKIRRIWADGRLIRDPRTGLGENLPLTIYLGTETQEPDPTIEADKGAGFVPAHRGSVYVVFTDQEMTEFGNRIANLEFEVLTKEPLDCPIESIFQGATSIEWGGGFSSTGLYPRIDAWPADDITSEPTITQVVETTIVVTGGSGDHLYGYVIYPGPTYIIGDATHRVYVDTLRPVLNDQSWDFAIGAGAITFSLTDTFHQSYATVNVGENSGITTGLFVHSAVSSVDLRRLFVFTGTLPHDGSKRITQWWELINAKVVRSGTVSPALTWYDIGIGNCIQHGNIQWGSGSFENNGQYCWHYWGAQVNGGYIRCYKIDEAGNFAQICTDIQLTDRDVPFCLGSVLAIGEGMAGVVAYKHYEVFQRFNPDGESEKVTLASIVSDFSLRANLTAPQIDVSALTDLVTGYAVTDRMDVRAALQPLTTAYFFDAVESDEIVKFPKRGGASIATIADDDLAAHEYGGDLPALTTIEHKQEDDLPSLVTVSYINQATDYQPGLQLAPMLTGSASRDVALQFAIVMDDEYAKRLADAVLIASWLEQ